MKKLLTTLVLLLVFTFSYSQSDTIPIPDEITVERSTTFDKVYSDVKEGLKGLGEALKVGSEHVYKVLVKQQVIKSIAWLISITISLLGLINFFKAYKSEDEEWMDGYNVPTVIGMFRMFLGFLFLLGLAISLCHINIIVTGFLNPEYGAMQDIVNFIK